MGKHNTQLDPHKHIMLCFRNSIVRREIGQYTFLFYKSLHVSGRSYCPTTTRLHNYATVHLSSLLLSFSIDIVLHAGALLYDNARVKSGSFIYSKKIDIG